VTLGIELVDVMHPLQGIEHVVMTEIGLVLQGMVIAAGDSHTTTYGA
jgi:3-isopropylmalate/(R)-2-methylmalate dehydratase large subunit